jgi:hypothetical protein
MTRQISLISLLPFYLGSWGGNYVRFNKRIFCVFFFVVSRIHRSLFLINLQYNILRPNYFQKEEILTENHTPFPMVKPS